MKIAIITRSTKDSPNMVAKDAAILESVSRELETLGAVIVNAEEDFEEECDAVCHMSRSADILKKLRKAEAKGVTVINNPESVERCSRILFMKMLQQAGVPQPPFRIIEDADELDMLHYPAWIKKAEGWSCHKDDVAYAGNAHEAKAILEQMHRRGIGRAIYSKHIEGDLIKFYAVGNDWFHSCYPEQGKTKFGLEALNGTPKHYSFDCGELKRIAGKAAEAIGVEIYGGDCIVDKAGNIYIIDINDFPSFSAVRKEAAEEIAKHIANTVKKKRDEARG